jgi:hypothetical protein
VLGLAAGFDPTPWLKDNGFEKLETIEREPYPEVEFESRRAYVFAEKT